MNYLAQGLNSGFAIGAQAVQNRLDNELRKQLRQDRLTREAAEVEASKTLRTEQRTLDAAKAEEERNDPRNVLARQKAQKEIDSLNNPQPPSEDDQLAADVRRIELQKKRDALLTPPPPTPAPTAKVRQNFGADGKGGYAEYELPTTDLEKTIGGANAAAYRDPFEEQITGLQTKIAREQSAIESGDTRSGFLGVGTSRADTVANSQRQLLKLEGLRLQDQVRKGVITQAEADARANQLMGAR